MERRFTSILKFVIMNREFKGIKGEWYGQEKESQAIKGAKMTGVLSETNSGTRIIGKIYATHKPEGQANLNLVLASKDMLNALKDLTHLHQCEQEGLTSGQPTAQEWLKAVDNAENVIQKALGHGEY